MKKLFIVLFALALLVGVTVPVFAGTVTPVYNGASGMGAVKTATLINASGTRAQTVMAITAGRFTPGKVKVLGYTASSLQASTECLVCLADSNTGDTASYVFNEAESQSTSGLQVWFPLSGIPLTYGLSVGQGSQTSVTIYYVEDLP